MLGKRDGVAISTQEGKKLTGNETRFIGGGVLGIESPETYKHDAERYEKESLDFVEKAKELKKQEAKGYTAEGFVATPIPGAREEECSLVTLKEALKVGGSAVQLVDGGGLWGRIPAGATLECGPSVEGDHQLGPHRIRFVKVTVSPEVERKELDQQAKGLEERAVIWKENSKYCEKKFQNPHTREQYELAIEIANFLQGLGLRADHNRTVLGPHGIDICTFYWSDKGVEIWYGRDFHPEDKYWAEVVQLRKKIRQYAEGRSIQELK